MSLFSLLSYVPLSFTYSDPTIGVISIGAPEMLAISVIIYYVNLNLVFGVISLIVLVGGCCHDISSISCLDEVL